VVQFDWCVILAWRAKKEPREDISTLVNSHRPSHSPIESHSSKLNSSRGSTVVTCSGAMRRQLTTRRNRGVIIQLSRKASQGPVVGRPAEMHICCLRGNPLKIKQSSFRNVFSSGSLVICLRYEEAQGVVGLEAVEAD